MHQRRVEDTTRYKERPEDAVAAVQEKGVELLLVEVSERRSEEIVDILRAPDPPPLGKALRSGSPPEFQCGKNAAGGGLAHAGNLHQFGRLDATEAPEGATAMA